MDYTLLTQSIKKECSFLEDQGYVCGSNDRNIWYDKSSDIEGFKINIFWTPYGDVFHLHAVVASKRFNMIESKIQSLLGGDLNNYFTIHTISSVDHIPKDLEYEKLEKNIQFKIISETDLKNYIDYIKQFYSKSVLAFFDKYKTVNDIHSYLLTLERKDISGFLTNSGNDLFYRELIIKYLTESDDANDYYNLVMKDLEPLKGNKTFDEIIANLQTLKQQLDNLKN